MSISKRDRAEFVRTMALYDGLVFKLPPMHREHYEPMVAELKDAIEEACPTITVDYLRVKIFNYGAHDGPKIVKVSVYGWPTNHLWKLPLKWMQYLDELHTKVYVDLVANDSPRVFVDEVFHALAGRKARPTHNSRNKNKQAERSYGVGIGDKDSAYEFTFYRRDASRRYGIEAKIKGKALERVKTDARQQERLSYFAEGYSSHCAMPFQSAATQAWLEFFDEMKAKGVDLGDYFTSMHGMMDATTEPTRAYLPASDEILVYRTDDFDDRWAEFYNSLDGYYLGEPLYRLQVNDTGDEEPTTA